MEEVWNARRGDTIGAVNKRLVLLLIPLTILVGAAVVVLLFAKPATPKVVDLYAGPEGSTYFEYAQAYTEYLADRGITVRIHETSGSMENLRLLAGEEKPAAAFALSGVDKLLDSSEGIESLESLGSLSFQPFWLFVRAGLETTDPVEFAGLKVALGPTEHDGRALATLVLRENGVRDQIEEPELAEQTPEAVAEALGNGDLDAAFLVGGPHSSAISTLLEAEGVTPASFTRLDAFTRLNPALATVTFPEGLYDLGRNVPDEDLQLLSPADNLVVRSDLHPAVVDLLLDAARSIHREPTLFADRGTFPNMQLVSLPLSEAAVRFYEEGPPTWRKYLPYWLASLISRFALIMAQVGAIVVVLLKGIPALVKMRFTMKSVGFYKRMDNLEQTLMAGGDWNQSMMSLDEIHTEIVSLKAPRSQLPESLELRQNVHDLRERMEFRHEDHPEAT